MSRSLRRGAYAAALVLALAPLAAACASEDETNRIQPDTASVTLDGLKMQNLQLVTGDPGSGLVALGGAIVNNENTPATVTRVSVQGLPTPATLKGPDGREGITVPAHGALYFTGAPDSGSIVFSDANLPAGSFQKVTFAFDQAGEASTQVTVHLPDSYYAPLKPTAPAGAGQPSAPEPSAPASPSGTGQPSGSPGSSTSAPPETPPTGAPGEDRGSASGAPTANRSGQATAPSDDSSRPARTPAGAGERSPNAPATTATH